ncbi:MAG: nickel-responsive transcriptional regulator NikR [Bryobacterales bacterium]|nr:nickel-responsive transcriptional regulator NikR [Bryobacterales bacterium]
MGRNEASGGLDRIGVAIDAALLEKFDALIASRGYANRSEAFRDLIRAELISESSADPAATVIGTLTLLYDHQTRLLSGKLTALQHEHHHVILSSLHVHLDHHNCLEVIILKGAAAHVRTLADSLIASKGVKHGKLVLTSSV